MFCMPPTKRLVLKLLLVLVLALVVVYVAPGDSEETKETVCKLIRVEMEDITVASWKIFDKLTWEDAQKSRSIPRQDAEYSIEGAFMLASGALPDSGTPASPQGYEPYTGEPVTDWMFCEEFRMSLLQDSRNGEVVFSPSTGWVYFRLDL